MLSLCVFSDDNEPTIVDKDVPYNIACITPLHSHYLYATTQEATYEVERYQELALEFSSQLDVSLYFLARPLHSPSPL